MQNTHYKLNLPYHIALIADVHNADPRGIIESLRAHRPEIICIAGDLFYGNDPESVKDQTNVMPLIEACADLAPTFYSMGNHEWILSPSDLEQIKSKGVHVLDNSWMTYPTETCADNAARRPLIIGGLTSEITKNAWLAASMGDPSRRFDLTDEINNWLDDFASLEGFKILLCHHPEYYDRYLKGRSIDLILSGHAHGGQWRIGDRGIFAPGQGLLPRLTSGVHGNLVISRGLANTAGPIPRINNPVEVVYLT